MALVIPTEEMILDAAAALIKGTQYNGNALPAKTVPRWVLGLALGEAISHLAEKDNDDNLLPVNSWVLTSASWSPSTVSSPNVKSAVPTNFTPGFDDWQVDNGGGDRATQIDYKIAVTGSLKIWQLLEYRQGSDLNNSEREFMRQRKAVIDEFASKPRIGLAAGDLEHDQLKFTGFTLIPFGTSYIHVAQGSLSFNFSYVASAA